MKRHKPMKILRKPLFFAYNSHAILPPVTSQPEASQHNSSIRQQVSGILNKWKLGIHLLPSLRFDNIAAPRWPTLMASHYTMSLIPNVL